MIAASVRPAADCAAAVAMLKRAADHAVNGESADELAEGCALLDVIEGGQPVGAVAVQLVGEEARITAFASRGQATYHELELIEAALQRSGVRRVRMLTMRPALVRNLVREGYELKRAELEKVL